MIIKKCLHHLQKQLLPYYCVLCQTPSEIDRDLCEACEQELPIMRQACLRCAQPLLHKALINICGDCLKSPPFFDHTFALFQYSPVIAYLITRLKFQQHLVYAKVLGELMAKHVVNEKLPECLIPIPLHNKRLRERGFNQALEIARPIARELQIPIDTISCQRIRHTSLQSQTPKEQRYKNVRQAFFINKKINVKHVAIIDDVITTGHTVNELSKVLRKAGVTTIQAWCVARAGNNIN